MKTKNTILGIVGIGISSFLLTANSSGFKNKTTIKIQFLSAKVIEMNGIGNEWFFKSEINNKVIQKGTTKYYDLSDKSELIIESTAIEEDPSSDDVGKEKLIITPDNLDELLEEHQVNVFVKVKEYYGRGAGNIATCKFQYIIE